MQRRNITELLANAAPPPMRKPALNLRQMTLIDA